MGLNGTPITPTDTTPAVYPPPTGTTVSAADVQSGEQALADNIYNLTLGGPTDYVEERGVLFSWVGLTDAASTSYWQFGNTGQPVQAGPAAAIVLYVHLDVPHGGLLQAVALNIDPANGHGGGGAGLTFPTLAFWKVNLSTGVRTQIETTVTDTWNAGGYETEHPLSIPISPDEQVDRDVYRYVLEFTAEAGANYAAGLSVITPTVTGDFRRLFSPGA